MYMYLSDRIRRLFLSGACPQNLSPKTPLSLKDLRFLQKTRRERNLTRTVVKQQKTLYEKHIDGAPALMALKDFALSTLTTSPFLHNKEFVKETGPGLGSVDFYVPEHANMSHNLIKKDKEKHYSEKTPIYNCVSCKVQKTIKTRESTIQNSLSLQDISLHNPLQKDPFFKPNQQLLEKQALIKYKTKNDNFNYNINLNSKPLTVFVQSIKIDKNILATNTEKKVENITKKEKDFLFEKKNFNPQFQDFSQSANNDIFTNCRYLYNRESLKTCIVPEIFKNQKPVSRAKTLLHERKKIALLYGQLAKKDIENLSRKANITGFFEENMFTLLESRVDVCIFRAGFSRTIAAARQLIRNGSVLMNGKKISSCKSRAKPGDFFTFTFKHDIYMPYKYTTVELYNLYLSSNLYIKSKIKLFTYKNKHFVNNPFSNKLIPENFESKLWKTSFSFFPYQHFRQPFCHSLYWSFFIYCLYKINPLVCVFQVNNCKPLIPTKALWDAGASKASPRGHLLITGIAPTGFQINCFLPLYYFKKKSFFFKEKSALKSKKCFALNNLYLLKQKKLVFFNLYTQLQLKKSKTLKSTKENYPFPLFKKKLSYNNLWAIWGQKPLHLEISHKTGAFVYMYKPQKIISPVCLDWI